MPARSLLQRIGRGVRLIHCEIPSSDLWIVGQRGHKNSTVLFKKVGLSHPNAERPFQSGGECRCSIADSVGRALSVSARVICIPAKLVVEWMLSQEFGIWSPGGCSRHGRGLLERNDFCMTTCTGRVTDKIAAPEAALGRPPVGFPKPVLSRLLLGDSSRMRLRGLAPKPAATAAQCQRENKKRELERPIQSGYE
jgi:hypothetical protein